MCNAHDPFSDRVGMNDRESVWAIARDADALETFYRAHLGAVQLFVARRVGTPEEAADLTADVFVAAIEASGSYRGDGTSPLAWLYGIARRVVADHFRSRERAARATKRIQGRALLDDDAIDRIAGRIDDQRIVRSLFTSLQVLPSSQRAVVELVAVDGLTLTEAATALGISPGSARVRYHRARRHLASALSPTTEVIS